ncbi:MAG: hypothetical protein ITD31_00640 [Nitrosospira sp.]|nr:hypothetical protein [Nitrosospira sp.]
MLPELADGCGGPNHGCILIVSYLRSNKPHQTHPHSPIGLYLFVANKSMVIAIFIGLTINQDGEEGATPQMPAEGQRRFAAC